MLKTYQTDRKIKPEGDSQDEKKSDVLLYDDHVLYDCMRAYGFFLVAL